MSGMLSRRHQGNCSAGTKAGDLGVSLGYGPYGYDLGGRRAMSRRYPGRCLANVGDVVTSTSGKL